MVAAGPQGQAQNPAYRPAPPPPSRCYGAAVPRLVAVVVALLLAASCSGPSTRAGVAELSGHAPAVRGALIAGGAFAPGDYRGKVLAVNFFNPFCGPCRKEQPELEAASRRLRGHGVVVVGVHYVGGDWPSSVSAAERYLKELRVTYPVLRDPSSSLARAFGIPGIPSTVVVDEQGRLRFRVLGGLKPGELDDLVRDLR
jgi:thiol-disulfide isomerase/thioredoxin